MQENTKELMMEEDNIIIKTINVNEFNQSMEFINEYTTFISNTLNDLIRNNDVKLKDLEQCIKFSNKIRNYSNYMTNNKEVEANIILED